MCEIAESVFVSIPGAAFFTTLTTASLLFGFGTTVAMAKKKDPAMFAKVNQFNLIFQNNIETFSNRFCFEGFLFASSPPHKSLL